MFTNTPTTESAILTFALLILTTLGRLWHSDAVLIPDPYPSVHPWRFLADWNYCVHNLNGILLFSILVSSVVDPDPHRFDSPGSGSGSVLESGSRKFNKAIVFTHRYLFLWPTYIKYIFLCKNLCDSKVGPGSRSAWIPPLWLPGSDPDPHWGKHLDHDPHWNQCGSTTLLISGSNLGVTLTEGLIIKH